MNELKKKTTSTTMGDENNHDNLFNLKTLKDGYVSIVDKMGYGKFKPYLQRLFHSVELMLVHEVTEFKKIDAKYQDMARQCHIYEKTLSLFKDKNYCDFSSFNESNNTYALDDLTKVTPFLAPDLLQSTLGAGNGGGGGGGSTSMQYRLPRQRSSLSNRQFVSTPLGPTRTTKTAIPLANFDDDSSFVLTNSFGFQQQKRFVDAFTEPEPIPIVQQKDFSCQIIPLQTDQETETIQQIFQFQATQTDDLSTESIACQIQPDLNDCSTQMITNAQEDFSCQFMPISIDQTTDTIEKDFYTQITQTDLILTNDYSCQITPEYVDQHVGTPEILTNDCSCQISAEYVDQQIGTTEILTNDYSCQITPESIDRQIETNEILTNSCSCQTTPEYVDQQIGTTEILTNDYSCQITPESIDRQTETTEILTENVALQSSLNNPRTFDDQYIQTNLLFSIDISIQCDIYTDKPDLSILPILFSEELPISNEIEIPIHNQKLFMNQQCQTMNNNIIRFDEYAQTSRIELNDHASQSTIITYANKNIQTEPDSNLYSSSVYILPTSINKPCYSSKLVILSKENHQSPPPLVVIDQEIQCELLISDIQIPIETESHTKVNDRKSIIQFQLDEKEKQMNRIIEEYATLYGEYEVERRRNMDLTEARDRLADHIKVLSDELGDREINQEKLLIRSCQQNKLINYMLPQIDCSPMVKKKHHSATSFRRLLPKFK